MNQVLKELTKMRPQVEYLMDRYVFTRENDCYLIVLWLKEFGGLNKYIAYIPMDLLIENSSKPASVWRLRQKIQHEDKRFLPKNPLVLKKRKLRAEDFRKAIRKV